MDAQTAAENFDRWDAALKTGDPGKVVALYADNLTLIPTLAAQPITNRDGAQKYFEFFGSFEPTVEMLEEHVIPISPESYVHCGIYRFMLNTREALNARFSFVWKKNGDTWEILHHHSSRVQVLPQ